MGDDVRVLVRFGIWGSLLAVIGCSAPEFASVDGVVTLDGSPLVDVEVQFIPEPGQVFEAPPASGYTNADGRYSIQSTHTFGVLVGRHRVCINDAMVMSGKGPQVDLESGEATAGTLPQMAPRVRVPLTYSDANRTPFKNLEIKQGAQTVDFSMTTNK